jgi:proline dehydrogenase
VREGYRVRVYIPFGKDWFPYLMRRLAERPANLLFFARNLLRGTTNELRRMVVTTNPFELMANGLGIVPDRWGSELR